LQEVSWTPGEASSAAMSGGVMGRSEVDSEGI